MKVVYVHEERAVIDFAERAANFFAESPIHMTYSEGSPLEGDAIQGQLFAVRWGIADQAVLVFKVDEYFEPRIYGDMVPEVES